MTLSSFIRGIYYELIFFSDDRLNKNRHYLVEKFFIILKMILTFGPIAYILNIVNSWFHNNHEFVAGFLVAVVFNAWFGIKKHRKLKTFDWEIFLKKTGQMLTIVIAVYILLSIVVKFAGDNILAEGFEIVIQVTTLLFPIGKCLKSIHIISDGTYPPEWIMKKLYNFEETGSVDDLFEKPKTKEDA